MAWRPHENLIAGELDNTVPGKVTGWLQFLGMEEGVKLDLNGDFHRDIRGTRIRLRNQQPMDRNHTGATGEIREGSYMQRFSTVQTGEVGDITAGLPPYDYVKDRAYVEWYSEENGRVVLELESEQVEVIGEPLPVDSQEPVSRQKQAENMGRFLAGLCRDLSRAGADQQAP